MALDPLACAYRNSTDRMVIVRCEAADGFYLERVVFPFELLTFECPAGTTLEIWTHGLGGPELMDRLPVDQLRLDQASEPAPFELLSGAWLGFADDGAGGMEAAAS